MLCCEWENLGEAREMKHENIWQHPPCDWWQLSIKVNYHGQGHLLLTCRLFLSRFASLTMVNANCYDAGQFFSNKYPPDNFQRYYLKLHVFKATLKALVKIKFFASVSLLPILLEMARIRSVVVQSWKKNRWESWVGEIHVEKEGSSYKIINVGALQWALGRFRLPSKLIIFRDCWRYKYHVPFA